MYQIPYEALYRCDKGHEFKAQVQPGDDAARVTCIHCYAEWLDANIPKAVQITPFTKAPMERTYD